MQSTRERILQHLQRNNQATAGEMATTFNLTQANIRHHLKQLEAQGQIESIGQTMPEQRGRPSQIYALTRAAQPDSLAELVSALLSLPTGGSRKRSKQLQDAASHLSGISTDRSKSITIRLGQTIMRLNDLNYKAHWEAHADSPHILLGACPYAQIINIHPELCEMDAYLISTLTGEDFSQIEKISRQPAGPTHCRFCLTETIQE